MNVTAKISRYFERSVVTLKLCREYSNTVTYNTPVLLQMQTFELKSSGVTILQGVEFPVFLLIHLWALQQCSAAALPVIKY